MDDGVFLCLLAFAGRPAYVRRVSAALCTRGPFLPWGIGLKAALVPAR